MAAAAGIDVWALERTEVIEGRAMEVEAAAVSARREAKRAVLESIFAVCCVCVCEV